MMKAKGVLSAVLRTGISVVLLVLLFRFKGINIGEILLDIRSANKLFLFLAFAVTAFNYVLCFLRWNIFLKAQKIVLPTMRVLISFCGGIFFNLIFPSAIGGDLARSIDLSRHTKKTKEVVATVILDRISGYVGLAVVVLVSLCLGWELVRNNFVILFSVGLIIFSLVVILLILFSNFFYSKINSFLHKPHAGNFRKSLVNLLDEMYYFKKHKKVLLGGLGYSLLVQIIGPVAFYLTARSLGSHNVNLIYFFVLVPIIGAVTMLPISMGGFGVRESTSASFFKAAGMDGKSAVAMALLNSVFILVIGAIGGLIYVFTVRHRRIQSHQSPPV